VSSNVVAGRAVGHAPRVRLVALRILAVVALSWLA
jgi:hypothetical protein